jgi:ureidoglycolate lyase
LSLGTDTVELVIQARALAAADFRPFGEVIEHTGTDRRHIIASAFDSDGSAVERLLWVSRFSEPGHLPLRVTAMERHPHSAQFFSPLSCHAYLVAVCPSHGDGSPNLDALSAFVAHGAQGVVYARNVWHHAMVVLKAPALFAVSMAKGCDDDDVWVAIDRHVTITSTAAAPS